ncbi:MAG: alpha/beta hydrolase [Deltaproteobacteria bacterium]|nr:MAG: alpha/beta hydrolase [Deltaproteobacteria bacterium]
MRLDGRQLHIDDHGTGDTVLLVHGWMMAGAVFTPLRQALLDAGYRVVVPDLRGSGKSDPTEDYTLAGYADDLAAVVDAIGPCVILGHSMGGALAQLVAIARPESVRGLILLNPVPASGLPLPDEAMGLFGTSGGDRDKQQVILGLATLTLDEDGLHQLLDIAGTVVPEAVHQSLVAWTTGGFADRLGEIRAPTHVIATSDPFLPPAFLDQAVVQPIAGAQLHTLEGPDHYPMWEAPEATRTLVLAILDGL